MAAKWPFDPETLDALPEELAELFRGLELTLLEEIASRLKISGQLNEVTVSDIKALRAHGIPLDEIKKAIQEATDVSEEKLGELLDDVVERNQKYYRELIDLAKVTAPETLLDEAAIVAIRRQTWSAFKNITGSMGFLVSQGGRLDFLPPAKAYEWALDSALVQVQSGAFSYNQAIANATRQLADSGLMVAYDKNGKPLRGQIAYESGWHNHIDVAVRRAVMSGVNALNSQYAIQSMEYLDTEYVEVSAHAGARDVDGPKGWESHKAWQGKVYRWKEFKGRADAQGGEPDVDNGGNSAIMGPSGNSGGASMRQNENKNTPVDVTQEYLDNARPGEGTIAYDDGYEEKEHKNEIKIAKWIHETFGGDIRLKRESHEEHTLTPDYLWNGKLWDLKNTTTEKAANSAIRHGLQQIKENPGGIILDYGDATVNLQEVETVIRKRMQWQRELKVDIMVVANNKVHIVLRFNN